MAAVAVAIVLVIILTVAIYAGVNEYLLGSGGKQALFVAIVMLFVLMIFTIIGVGMFALIVGLVYMF